MRMLVPALIGGTNVISSNLLEDEYSEWNSSNAYVVGDRVIKVGDHLIYEAVSGNTNTDPTTDIDQVTGIGSNWIRVGATNRFKPFDGFISQVAEQIEEIRYEILPGEFCDGLALFGLDATLVQLIMTDPVEGEVYNQTKSLISNDNVIDWYSWFFAPLALDEEVLFSGLPPYRDATFEVIVTNPGATVKIGQIVLGRDHHLGTTAPGTGLSTEDYSTFERDTFGRVSNIVERPYIRIVDFDFAIKTENVRYIERTISAQRAKAAVYYIAPDTEGFGALIFGKARPLSINLSDHNLSNASLEVEGFI